jgi:hypothetical protein
MSTFVNQTASRVAIDARIAERRRTDNELTTRGDDDYHLPTARAKAQAELTKWLCQI